MATQKSTVEIIEETVAAYTRQCDRAIEDGWAAKYVARNGNRGPVARCMTEQGLQSIQTVEHDNVVIDDVVDNLGCEIDDLLREEYRGHSLDFWVELQCLHAHLPSWNKIGLSDEGKRRVARMIELFA